MDRTRLLSIVPERPARSRRGEPSSTHVARNQVERSQVATAGATDAVAVLGRWRFATRPVPPTRHTSGGCLTTPRRQSGSAAPSPVPDLLVTVEDGADDLMLTPKSAANERRLLVSARARIVDSSDGPGRGRPQPQADPVARRHGAGLPRRGGGGGYSVTWVRTIVRRYNMGGPAGGWRGRPRPWGTRCSRRRGAWVWRARRRGRCRSGAGGESGRRHRAAQQPQRVPHSGSVG